MTVIESSVISSSLGYPNDAIQLPNHTVKQSIIIVGWVIDGGSDTWERFNGSSIVVQ
ncbi:hypothetical protein HDU76_001595, partial [Blyttiomyces sp. JEL0837]